MWDLIYQFLIIAYLFTFDDFRRLFCPIVSTISTVAFFVDAS